MKPTNSIPVNAKLKPALLFLLLGMPGLSAILYALQAQARFLPSHALPHFILGQLLLLLFWIVNTLLLACAVKEFPLSQPHRWAALGIALSYFALGFIYVYGWIGAIHWGALSNYKLLLVFIPDYFRLTKTLGIPPALPLLLMAVPLGFFLFLFQWQAANLGEVLQALTGYLRRPSNIQKTFWFCFLTAWLAVFLDNETSISYRLNLGHFRYDPIARFFGPDNTYFPPSKERSLWIQKDQLAERQIQKRVSQTHNVILFVLDALRADHLNAYGYLRKTSPYITSLSQAPFGRKIDYDLANGSESRSGIMSILTSKEPRDISQTNLTLPDFFTDNGFKTRLFLSGDHTWFNVDNAYGRKIDVFVDGTLKPGPEGVDDDRLLLQLVDSLPADDGRYHFFYFHLMSTHECGYVQNHYKRYQPTVDFVGVQPESNRFKPQTQKAIVNLYDDSILQADDVVRQILEKLQTKGYLKDYRALLTADHGQLLGEHDYFGHGNLVALNILHVPMILFGSKPIPTLPDKHFAVNLDVAPTLADWAGLDVPTSWQGCSLLRPRTREWTIHYTPCASLGCEGAVVDYSNGKILKYSRVLVPVAGLPDHESIFDIERDPEEKNNLLSSMDPARVLQFRSLADEHLSGE